VSAQHGGNTWPVTDATSISTHLGARTVVGVVTTDVVVDVDVVVEVEVAVAVLVVTSAVASGTATGSDPQAPSAAIRMAQHSESETPRGLITPSWPGHNAAARVL
jgi:hypothetical protein